MPELQGLEFGEIACLCHAYCAVVKTHWFQVNVKKRTRADAYMGMMLPAPRSRPIKRGASQMAFAKCQCYNGEPVFKKHKPTYATGYVTNWAYNWYNGIGDMAVSRANNMKAHGGVSFDVPETAGTETKANPHQKDKQTNDFILAGFGTKYLRQVNHQALKKWHGVKSYKQLGSPTQEELAALPTISNIDAGTSTRMFANNVGQDYGHIGDPNNNPNYLWDNHSATGRRRAEQEAEEEAGN
jgi:hypothetical protein